MVKEKETGSRKKEEVGEEIAQEQDKLSRLF